MTPTAPAAGRPERDEVRIGCIPLTDCASIVMAAERGFDRRHGVRIVPTREASWAGVRDKLLAGELHMAPVLYGLVYGVHLGIGMPGGRGTPMAVLMTINQNGQAITLSRALASRGAVDGPSLARLIGGEGRRCTFAQTFPTGTHAMWLYYWLASVGIHPLHDATVITVPPPQMLANMRAGAVDGYCAGEPWGQRAVADGIGITAATSQAVWPDHPEKVLGSTAAFADGHPHTTRAVMRAVLEASRWIDEHPQHRREAAEAMVARGIVAAEPAALAPRMLGEYEDGLGHRWHDAHPLRFHADGAVNVPYRSDGMWFLTQHKRWGLLREHPDYLGVAREIHRTDVYREVADELGVPLPAAEMRRSTLIDGTVWDGAAPAAYADAFRLRA